jgi:hypothetical protein
LSSPQLAEPEVDGLVGGGEDGGADVDGGALGDDGAVGGAEWVAGADDVVGGAEVGGALAECEGTGVPPLAAISCLSGSGSSGLLVR